jgi:hypothetical protein
MLIKVNGRMRGKKEKLPLPGTGLYKPINARDKCDLNAPYLPLFFSWC